VAGVHGTSRNNKRPAGVAEALQVSKHLVEFHIDDSRHVLTKHPSGSCLFNNSAHFRPERAVIFCASSFAGSAVRLARKSPCDEVGANASHVSDVAEVGDFWPVALEDFARIRFYFAEGYRLPACPLSGQSKAPDAGK
jgi:hypothetical protein